MPIYTEQKFFYELLVRGTPQGIAGAHASYLTRTFKDGVFHSETPGDAMPIAMAQADPGIPLADVLGDINTQALATIEARDASIAALTAARDTALTGKATAEATRDAAVARVAELEAQIAGPIVNGIPQRVTMRQAQLALLGAGKLDAVEAAIAAIPDATQRKAAQITWDKSSAVERNNGLIAALAPALGLSSGQIDALFLAASKL